MRIKQFPYSADNFSYILYSENTAIAIDGGAVKEILSFIGEKGLKLKYVVNTHSHFDHTLGNNRLVKESKGRYLTCESLVSRGEIKLDDEKIQILHTPGHTNDSLVFHFNSTLITGDTLFNGTVGNCFTEDYNKFLNSIKLLTAFSGETRVYAGHDYVKYAMAFAKIIEPGNENIQKYLSQYKGKNVFSILADELKVNPFLRFNDPNMIGILEKKGLSIETEYDRWMSVMSLD